MIIRLTDKPDNTKSFAEVSYPVALGEQLIDQNSYVVYYVSDPNKISVPAFFLYYMPKKLKKITRYTILRRFSIFTLDSTQKELGVYLVDFERMFYEYPTMSQGYIPGNTLSEIKKFSFYTFFEGRFYEKISVEMYNPKLIDVLEKARPSDILKPISLLGEIEANFYVPSNLAIVFALRSVSTTQNLVMISGIGYQIMAINVELHETYLALTTETEEAKFFAKLYKPIYVRI